MISRRYLRTKVMQAIFAHEMNRQEDIRMGEKKLTRSIEDFYVLFLYFFSLIPQLKFYREKKIEDAKEKINPSFLDLNPNTKFIDNQIFKIIEEHPALNRKFNEHNIHWHDTTDLIAHLYKEVIDLNEYQLYMDNNERSFQEDKQLLLTIIEKVFAPNQLLHWFLEEKNVHWFDDYNDALLAVYRNISSFKESLGSKNKILSLFKNKSEDIQFYQDLYLKTIQHSKEYEQLIQEKLENWELERVIGIDIILLKMGICEFLEFETIPVKVTINEYIELAKSYSSPKSGLFINGILDKLLIDFKNKNQLRKIGRGLLN